MPPTITFNEGDVVIVKFPFTDLAAYKKRPAVVVSDPSFAATYGDIVVVALTSQRIDASTRLHDWRAAGLLKPTWVKRLIATLSRDLVDKRLGSLTASDCARVRDVVAQMIVPGFRAVP